MAGGDSDGMDELYETPQKGDSPKTVDDEEREDMDVTASIPLKVIQGKHPDPPEVGDEVVLKVKSVSGDMATVVYSETPPEEIGEGEAYDKGGDYQSANDELDELSAKGGDGY